MYLDTNNLYGWTMSQKLPVNSFKWKKILEVDVESSKNLHDLHNDLPFLLERMKI